MQISANMNLSALAQRMGDVATEQEAEAMRGLLVGNFDGMDTADISESAWLDMLSQVASASSINN